MPDNIYAVIDACMQNILRSFDAFEERLKSNLQARYDSCPRFSDGDPVDWLFKLQLYFSHNNIRPANYMIYAALHLDRPASIWYRATVDTHPALTFPLFVDVIVREYGSSTIVPTLISTFKDNYEDALKEQYVLKSWPRIAPTEWTTPPQSLSKMGAMTTPNFEHEQNGGNDLTSVIAITDPSLPSTTPMMKNNIKIVPEELKQISTFFGIPRHYLLNQDTMMRQNYLAVNKFLSPLSRQSHEQELLDEGVVKPIPTSSIILVFDPGGHSSSHCSVRTTTIFFVINFSGDNI